MKVAICIPSREMCHASFAFDLANLVGHWTAKHGASGALNICNVRGTLIADQRTDLVRMALSSGADSILWLDDDMRFPKDALDRLLARGKPIVGCNYTTRVIPPEPTATRLVGGKWRKVQTRPESTGLEAVDFMGFGCMLVKADVFRKLDVPWFHLGYSSVDHKFIGEDVYFGMKATAAGYEMLLDHDLSKEIRHIGSLEYRHEHVEACEEAA